MGNIVENALKHGGREVKVRVANGQRGHIEISDGGVGVEPQELPRIFERFYKVDRSRSGEGSGLGLAIALENSRLLGASIEVSSKAGRGIRFRIYLPPSPRLRAKGPIVRVVEEPESEKTPGDGA